MTLEDSAHELVQQKDFWPAWRAARQEQQLQLFLEFYADVQGRVEEGTLTLPAAGEALRPAIEVGERMTTGDFAMISWLAEAISDSTYEHPADAEDDWRQIQGILEKYRSR